MKKTLTKITAIVIALSALFAVSGCADKTEESKIAVTGFMDALCQLDFATASNYVDGEELLGEIPFENLDGAKELFLNELGTDMAAYSDLLMPVADTMLTKITDSMSYEITASEKTDDGYLHKVSFKSIDFDQVGDMEFLQNMDYESIATELISELLDNGTISLNSSQEDMMRAVMSALPGKFIPVIEEGMSKMETTTYEFEFLVTDVDGSWKINNEKSSFETFGDAF